MNPIKDRFQNANGSPPSGPLGNMQNMMNQFQQFKAGFQGNPQQQVEALLQSGRMSQEQFQQLSNMARQFQQMMGR